MERYVKIKLTKDHNCNVTMPEGSVNYVRAKKGDVLEVREAYAAHLKEKQVAVDFKEEKEVKGPAPENKARKPKTKTKAKAEME